MTRKTVLVVDDDEDVSVSIVELLGLRGYHVEVASNGQEALDRLAAGLPGVILLDMKMPVMNGWEFARIFRQRHDHLAPIIVVTAAADAQKRAAEIGADAWLAKPFESDDLYAQVALQLDRA
jgi:CheY-like chemotaxis protein